MADSKQSVVATFMVLLLVIIGPLTFETNNLEKLETEDDNLFNSSGVGVTNYVDLSGGANVNTNVYFEVPELDPVTGLEISLEPDVLEKYEGFIWDSKNDWDNINTLIGDGIRINTNDTVSNRNNGEQFWTSPLIGWRNNAVQQTEISSYSPLYIDAYIPKNAHLNWSIIDSSGAKIPGFSGSNDALIPTNLIDYENVDIFRLNLTFSNNQANNGPVLYSISGDGAQKYDFSNEMMGMKPGWQVNCGATDSYYECGTVEDFTIDQVGTSYLNSNNVALNSNNGSGLSVDYTANRAYFDYVDEISAVSPVGMLYTNDNAIDRPTPESYRFWDFNSGSQGWTFSNNNAQHITSVSYPTGSSLHSPGCGMNGAGGSIQFRSGAGSATSPIVDISANGAGSSLNIWIRPGSSNCGESPDSGDNLRISYKNSNNVWTVLDTLVGPGYTTSLRPVQQYSTILPTAAFHANSQFRVGLTAGAGSNFDYWFIDDVTISDIRQTFDTSSMFGSGLITELTTTPIIDGVVDSLQIQSLGSGYVPSQNVPFNGQGTGLVVDYQASPITSTGLVSSSQKLTGGSGYVTNGPVVQTTTSGNGNGMAISYSANQYTTGIVDQVSTVNQGTGYFNETVVPTINGTGTGLTVSIDKLVGEATGITQLSNGTNYSEVISSTTCVACSGIGLTLDLRVTSLSSPVGRILFATLEDGGSGYSIGDVVLVNGGDNNSEYEITSISPLGQVLSVTVANGGSGYSVGDIITIIEGNNDSLIQVTGTTETGGVIQSYTLENPGSGYQVNDIVTVNGGVTDAQLRVNSVYSVGGNITSLSIVDAGSNYNVGNNFIVPGGDLNARIRISGITQIGGNVTNAEIFFGGEGYSVNDIVTIDGGDQQAQFSVISTKDIGGNITSISADSGEYFSIGESFVIPGGKNDAIVTVSDIDKTGYRFGNTCDVMSEWMYSNAPVKELSFDYEGFNTILEIMVNDDNTWTQISPTSTIDYLSDEIIYRYKIKLSSDSPLGNFWSVSDLSWTEKGGISPTNPYIDLNIDGIIEWGDGYNSTGQWGWQDAFQDGSTHQIIDMGLSGVKTISALMPKNNLQSLTIGFVSTGMLNSMNIKVGSNLIESYSFSNQSSAYISLNESQLVGLSIVTSNLPSIFKLNNSFVLVDFEIFGTGLISVSGYSAPNKVSANIISEQESNLVLQLNDARNNYAVQNGNHIITIPIGSDTAGKLQFTIDSFSSSNAVALIETSMDEEISVLTTSQRWLTMNSKFQLLNSDVGLVRFDVQGLRHTATWLIPTGGNPPIGQGDSNLVELHPMHGLNFSQIGNEVNLSVTFRIKQGWDDENYLKVNTRTVLSNGVISMPATQDWGVVGGNVKALENDFEIKSVEFSDGRGTLSNNDYYVMAGSEIDISVDIGFEDLIGTDSFFDGEGIVTMYNGEVPLANTTSLNGDRWDFTISVPFTNGILDWRIEVVPLDGAGVTENDKYGKEFFSDAVSPSIINKNIFTYDHRVPSSTQAVQIQISDQPILPQNIEAMVWREWINDYNMDGRPSSDEYASFAVVLPPSDLTAFVGQYTLLIDDSGGVIGDKVAVYLTGNDAAGHQLEQNGSAEDGDFLFMYQLKADGPPSIPTAAFSWDGGRQTWLHPMIEYEFDVMMIEPNGASDLSTVEVQLASQQNSDPLPISWNFITGDCTTTSPHLVIDDCDMIGQNGPAGPYEVDLTLNVKFHLLWTIPDLGDTKREPKLIVMDRAGNTDQQAFPTLRWQSSGDMYIPDETIQLFIDQGTVVEDGARIAPSSSFEVSGDVLFKETNTRPDFDCPVNVMFDSVSYPVTALNGAWTAVVTASESSGKKALTWGVDCYSGQGGDVTDESDNRWILVDGTGPTPIEIINPRPNTILETDVYEVRVAIDEEGGLDIDSLQLEWWVEDELTGDRLTTGFEPMTLEGTDISGPQIEVYAEIDLSGITDTMIQNRLILFIKINGRDLADNSVQGMNGAPSGGEIAQWNLEWLRPEFSIGPLDVSYTRLIIEVGQSTSVQALVDNTGSLDGTVDATVYVVKLNGSKDVLQRPSIDIPAGGKGLITVDWAPTSQGIQWIEVELDNGQTSKGPTVDVRPARDQGFVENLFGDVNPVIGSIVALIFVSIIATGLLWARKATRGKGARSEHDWDEYSSEMEDDDYDEDEDENGVDDAAAESSPNTQEIQPASSLGAASAALGVAQTTPAAEAETDWVMGSDGYWWYHNKATNEWWYKDENGDIVQFN